MNAEQLRSVGQEVIYLAGCAVNETKPDLGKVSDLESVYALAARHKLSAAVAIALESAGQKDARSSQAIASALKRAALFEQALAQVKAALEAAGIWYMPLKGAVLKAYYPQYGVREMADCDILFDASRAEDVRVLMERLGFQTERFGVMHHDVYFKKPLLNFQMHLSLFDPIHEKLHAYYGDVYKRLVGDGWEKRFSPEDFYLYVTAHAYKHYTGGGAGLRSLLDTYVYLKKEKLDMDYVAAEAEKLGIAGFEAANRSLALRLFSGQELTAEEKDRLDYVLSSGAYGTTAHQVENRLRANGWGKARYALNRFFVPISQKNRAYAVYARRYPFFYRHKLLLPLLPFYRILRSLKSGKLIREAKTIVKTKKSR